MRFFASSVFVSVGFAFRMKQVEQSQPPGFGINKRNMVARCAALFLPKTSLFAFTFCTTVPDTLSRQNSMCCT